MQVLDEIRISLERYLLESVTLQIVDVEPEAKGGKSQHVQCGEVWHFSVKVSNAGAIKMKNVLLEVRTTDIQADGVLKASMTSVTTIPAVTTYLNPNTGGGGGYPSAIGDTGTKVSADASGRWSDQVSIKLPDVAAGSFATTNCAYFKAPAKAFAPSFLLRASISKWDAILDPTLSDNIAAAPGSPAAGLKGAINA